ncbi:hypothetical protein LTR56_000478 [Elasticomyces elasticus]|nr:hypothetical protein LTR22_014206 [Elasticomyces elasticus]KAK3660720.1 hypothetical protein LTR56_000478 [Elasticomyces elasticus]KAK4922866.1 hypothetical protein LTR49_009873 [Elasticomyces elasticus]KAK5759758.1 hypothetical protein LTS12_010098 [Elasticomyces elasticus]
MAEQLVQEYLDRAQAAEQDTLQLKIQLSTERADFEMRLAERSKTVDEYSNTIDVLDEFVAEKVKRIAELEKAAEEIENKAPSNLVTELKGMLKSALEKVEELEGAAAPTSATMVKGEPENDLAPYEVPASSPKTPRLPGDRAHKRFVTRPLAPEWPRGLHKAAQSGYGHAGPARTRFVPPHLRTREEAAALGTEGL